MAQKGVPGLRKLVDILMTGDRERNQATRIAKRLRDAGINPLHAQEAAQILTYKKKPGSDAMFLRHLQDHGYISRQAK